jgi:predicted RNA-binding Zn ribbon-like protein
MSTTPAAPGLTLTSPEGTSYRFDPGALCLELLTTGGPGAYARWEVLHDPGALRDWTARSRLRPTPVLRLTGEDVTAARGLRDALWRMATARVEGDPPPADDVAVVNTAAAAPPLVPVLDARPAADGRRWAAPATGAHLLSTVARDAVEVFGGPLAGRIRECGAHDCKLVFLDTSRPGRRRWCSMERCGNRHKIRALRARREER